MTSGFRPTFAPTFAPKTHFWNHFRAITAFVGPEGYFSLATIAFGALALVLPKYDYRLGKTLKKESRLLNLRRLGSSIDWAAANGSVTNGGLRGVCPPFLEFCRNRPFSPFFCLFLEGAKSSWEIQKTEEKGLFPQISSDLLKPPSLKPPFAALQLKVAASGVFSGDPVEA